MTKLLDATSDLGQIVDLAGVKKDVGYILQSITKIEGSIKELSGVYVTKQEFQDENRALQLRAGALEKSATMWKFLSPVLSSALTAVVVFLLMFYLQNATR